ncbi:FIG01011804: hypothetical protein [hydrothermal vent metagenome]|uniref:Stringent starvation protein B n=1 Tax=hydrothermal vent metagenome TaxID=652676 RepID=A0A3B0T0X0_9ZZZZ
MADNKLDYQKMTQDALRGVVRAALKIAARDGLPGDHHFFVAFSTGAPGVNISARLRERHPEEMTIVIQHQYWDLDVTQNKFTIKLSFNNIPETLVVPFAAVKGFLDPSVQFGLQFETGTIKAPSAEAETLVKTPTPDEPDENASDTAISDPKPSEVVSLDAFRKK